MSAPSVIILTHVDRATGEVLLPHLGWLRESNPLSDVHVVVGADSPRGRRDNWKNGDRPLRDWWRSNHSSVKGDLVAVIEWDTLVSCLFPALPSGLDLAGAMAIPLPKGGAEQRVRRMHDPGWTPGHWFWWPDLPRMGLPAGSPAVGLISFGCFLMRRSVLDSVAGSRWDAAYSCSIQNELRFPTAALLSGHLVGEVSLPYVRFDDTTVGPERGIYHSVDSPFTGDFADEKG